MTVNNLFLLITEAMVFTDISDCDQLPYYCSIHETYNHQHHHAEDLQGFLDDKNKRW